jgi:hypothetical protein
MVYFLPQPASRYIVVVLGTIQGRPMYDKVPGYIAILPHKLPDSRILPGLALCITRFRKHARGNPVYCKVPGYIPGSPVYSKFPDTFQGVTLYIPSSLKHFRG